MREGCTGTPADDALAPPLGASPWERTLFDHLTTHIVQERELLEEYVRAAAHTESKALAYLINWLIDDERRHHGLFMQLALSLKASVELQADSPEVPRMDFDENTVEVLDTTRRLLHQEEQDLCELKALRRDLRDVKDTTLWDLLVELMQRDTDKHIAILRFAHSHAV